MPSEAVREMGLKILEERRFLRARAAHLQVSISKRLMRP
jgi:hypothetical protein